MKKKSLVATLATVAAIAAVGVGATFAYFTDSDSATNTFTMGKVDITVEENWDPEDGENIVPGQTIDKAPFVVVADDSNDAYVIMTVDVPSVDFTDDNVANPTDLFTFTVNDGWTQIGDATYANGVRTFTFGYNTVAEAKEQTVALFDKVTFANITEKQAEVLGQDTKLDVVVNGYAIQSEGFTSVADAWAAYGQQNNK